MITSNGLTHNEYRNQVQAEITAEDLFNAPFCSLPLHYDPKLRELSRMARSASAVAVNDDIEEN